MSKNLFFCALAILLIVFSAGAMAVEVKKEEVKTVAFKVGGTVHLSALEGNMVVQGWDRDEVQIRMVKRAWGRSEREAQALLDAIEVVIREGNDRLMIRETPSEGQRRHTIFDVFDRDFWEERGWRSQVVDFELRVPRHVQLRLEGDEGDVELSQLQGKISVEMDEGDIHVDSVETDDLEIRIDEGDVSVNGCRDVGGGLLKIDADEGRIRIENCRFDEMDLASDEGDLILTEVTVRRLWLTADEGDVEADFQPVKNGNYRIEVEEGDIELVLAESPELDVKLMAREGQIDSDFRVRVRDLDDGSVMEGQLGGNANGQLKAVTDEGDILIRMRR